MTFLNALKRGVLFLMCLTIAAHSAADEQNPTRDLLPNSDQLYSALRATIEKHGVENVDILITHPILQPINVWDVSSLLAKIAEVKEGLVAAYISPTTQQSLEPILSSSGHNGMDAVRSLFYNDPHKLDHLPEENFDPI